MTYLGAAYKLVVRDASGARVWETAETHGIAYAKKRNQYGVGTFEVADSDPIVPLLQAGTRVEVWRSNPSLGLPWYRDFVGLHFDEDWFTTKDGVDTFASTLVDLKWLLKTRRILYKASYPNRSMFNVLDVSAIASSIVQYNFGSPAGMTDRVVIPASTLISSIVAPTTGVTTELNCAWDNCLTTIQKLAELSGSDFDVTLDGGAFTFRWYPTGQGVDRTGDLRFSLEAGNISQPMLRLRRTLARTVIAVGGQDTGLDRRVVYRTGPDYPGLHIEDFHNASGQVSTDAGLNAEGDRMAEQHRLRREMDFEIVQTPECYYGLHYCVGGALSDTGLWEHRGLSGTARIIGVSVEFDGTSETISVESRNE